MPKILIECEDPNSFEAIQEAAFASVGKCVVATYKHHKEMVKAGVSKNKSQSAKKIAEGSGESVDAVRMRIQRGEKKVEPPVQKESKTSKIQEVVPPLTDSGGSREGAGRTVRNDCHCGVCGEEFKDSYPLWHCDICSKHLEMKVSECVSCRKDARPDDRIPHTIIDQKEPDTPPEVKEISHAIDFAKGAIEYLSKIDKDDPGRREAFDMVGSWMAEHA